MPPSLHNDTLRRREVRRLSEIKEPPLGAPAHTPAGAGAGSTEAESPALTMHLPPRRAADAFPRWQIGEWAPGVAVHRDGERIIFTPAQDALARLPRAVLQRVMSLLEGEDLALLGSSAMQFRRLIVDNAPLRELIQASAQLHAEGAGAYTVALQRRGQLHGSIEADRDVLAQDRIETRADAAQNLGCRLVGGGLMLGAHLLQHPAVGAAT